LTRYLAGAQNLNLSPLLCDILSGNIADAENTKNKEQAMDNRMITISIASGLLAFSSMAMALNKVDHVDLTKDDGIHINDGKIYINPVNGNYGQASKTTVSYHLKMKAGCNGQNLLKTAYVAFGNENVSKNVIEADNNYQVGVGTNLAKEIGWKTVEMKVPLNKLGFNPAVMCQNMLESKMSQGANKMQVMNQEHVLKAQVLFSAVATCGKLGKNNDNYGVDKIGQELQVICKAGAQQGIGGIQAKPPGPITAGTNVQATAHVTKTTFQASPATVTGTCPAKVRFSGSISSSGAGDVQYRVLFPVGFGQTNVRTMKFTQAGTLNISNVEFTATKSMPVASAALEIIGPNKSKSYAHFKVNCIAAGGPNSIQQQAPKATIVPGAIKPADPRPAQPGIKRAPTSENTNSTGGGGGAGKVKFDRLSLKK
jgi:hypothetical protein